MGSGGYRCIYQGWLLKDGSTAKLALTAESQDGVNWKASQLKQPCRSDVPNWCSDGAVMVQ